MDTDIADLVKNRKEFCDVKKNGQKAPMHNWDITTRNWQRVHIDYAGLFMECFFFVVIDAKFK